MKRLFSALAVWLALGCSSPTGPAELPLRVTTTDAAVQLENVSKRPIFYFLYEREAAALINWAACVEPACPSLAPGARTAIPYPAIGGYAPGKGEAIVWWWVAIPGAAGGRGAGPVHAVIIRL